VDSPTKKRRLSLSPVSPPTTSNEAVSKKRFASPTTAKSFEKAVEVVIPQIAQNGHYHFSIMDHPT
jgi:hypothetical protein